MIPRLNENLGIIAMQDGALVVGLFIGLAAEDGHAKCVGDQFGAHVLGD